MGKQDGEWSVQKIREVPALHLEAKAVVKSLYDLAQPCGEDGVRQALQPLVLVYGVSEAARTSAFWKVYFQSLGSFPMSALQQAAQDYADLPDSQFFPKPGQLKSLAEVRATPIHQAASRARRAADTPAYRQPTPEPHQPDKRMEALKRADELARSIPMKVRVNIPFSQWPEEYRAIDAEAAELRRSAR